MEPEQEKTIKPIPATVRAVYNQAIPSKAIKEQYKHFKSDRKPAKYSLAFDFDEITIMFRSSLN